jgi:predicted phage terminase large subunit-like protein
MATHSDAAMKLAIRTAAQDDLHFFSKYTFAKRKGYKWKDNWHHKLICEALMRVYRGEVKNLVINLPPRYSKTELAVLNFVAWAMGKQPDSEFIHLSYSATLAENNSNNTKSLMQHEAYADCFDTKLASNAQAHWKTTAGGVMYATGSDGTITGFGAGKVREGFGGAIIIDDPHKAGEAGSDAMRGRVVENFGLTVESRRNAPHTPIIVIMQRLHESDLSGFLLAGGNGEKWEHLMIPAVNERDEALWPWKHDRDTLANMERANPYVFAGQYMQRPAPLGGGIFKSAWWCWYRPEAAPRFKRIIQSWDTAFKTKEANDYSVCTTWGEGELGFYLLDILKDKWEFPDLKRIAVSHAAKWNPHAVLVEDKASGQSLIQELRSGTRLFVVPVQKGTDKVSNANAVTPIIESGRVFLPEGHPEVAGLVQSCGQFPNGAHDDDVDSVTQALNYMARGGGGMGLFDYMAAKADDLKRIKEDALNGRKQ